MNRPVTLAPVLMPFLALCIGVLAPWPAPAQGQEPSLTENDFLTTSGKLSQIDFYRIVSCRAQPGGPCTETPVRWSPDDARDIAVGFAPVPPDYPSALAAQMSAALDRVIYQINETDAALHLSRSPKGSQSPVTIYLSPSVHGEPIRGTGLDGIDGEIIGAALVTVWWDDADYITDADIVMAADLPPDEVQPVLLEEITQAMGLLTDIRNPVYQEISVFSEDSNAVTKLGPQDRAALLLHYPRP